MGLVILGALVLYFLLAIAIVIAAIKHAKKNGKSAKRWGWGAALVMYLIPFWDWIPTVVVHQYYCKTEAGFWVYKTPGQWKKENPRVAETLADTSATRLWMHLENKSQITYLNERFEDRRSYKHIQLIPVTIFTDIVIDRKSGEVLAKHVTAGSGYGNMMVGNDWRSLKFWLNLGSCEGETFQLYGQYVSIRRAYERIGRQE